MFPRLTKEDFQLIEEFISGTNEFSKEEILDKLGINSDHKYMPGHIELTFAQLELDIETTIRIPRDYLSPKVLNRDISDVSLENLETALQLLISKKRTVNNVILEGLFESFKKQKTTKAEKKLIKEAEERLKLFFEYQNTIKEIIEHHIEMKKIFASPKLTKISEFKDLSFLSEFDEIIHEKLNFTSEILKKFTPALKQPHLMDEKAYKQVMDSNMAELENDIGRFEQISEWKKIIKSSDQKEQLEKVEAKVWLLQRMHRGAIFIVHGAKKNINKLIALLEEQTYALEAMIDNFTYRKQ